MGINCYERIVERATANFLKEIICIAFVEEIFCVEVLQVEVVVVAEKFLPLLGDRVGGECCVNHI